MSNPQAVRRLQRRLRAHGSREGSGARRCKGGRRGSHRRYRVRVHPGDPRCVIALRKARRVVVKVGTSSLTRDDGRLEPEHVEGLVAELCALLEAGREVVCVTSGAIAAGLGPLGLEKRPKDMPSLQAAAAVGQSHLMDAYATAFESRGRACGQVLVTRSDFLHRQQYVNAQNTFQRLLALGAVPVVNENDTVSTDEIKFGENDLARCARREPRQSRRAGACSPMSTDCTTDATARVIGEVDDITPAIEALAGGSASSLGSGGMRSKLDAARIATASGVPVVIAGFGPGALKRVLRRRSRRHALPRSSVQAHVAQSMDRIRDDAARARRRRRRCPRGRRRTQPVPSGCRSEKRRRLLPAGGRGRDRGRERPGHRARARWVLVRRAAKDRRAGLRSRVQRGGRRARGRPSRRTCSPIGRSR